MSCLFIKNLLTRLHTPSPVSPPPRCRLRFYSGSRENHDSRSGRDVVVLRSHPERTDGWNRTTADSTGHGAQREDIEAPTSSRGTSKGEVNKDTTPSYSEGDWNPNGKPQRPSLGKEGGSVDWWKVVNLRRKRVRDRGEPCRSRPRKFIRVGSTGDPSRLLGGSGTGCEPRWTRTRSSTREGKVGPSTPSP